MSVCNLSFKPGRNPQVDHARAVKEYSRSSADQVSSNAVTVHLMSVTHYFIDSHSCCCLCHNDVIPFKGVWPAALFLSDCS